MDITDTEFGQTLIHLAMPCVCKNCGKEQDVGEPFYDYGTYWLCSDCETQ